MRKDYKVVSEIYETTTYDIFSFERTNRKVKDVSKLKKDIEENGLLYEILVNEDFKIIDGQRRFNALKELGMPIQFKVKEKIGIKETIGLNTVSKNWSDRECIEHYAKSGNDEYIKLIQISKDYNLTFHAITRTKLSIGEVKKGTIKLMEFHKMRNLLDKFNDLRTASQTKNVSQGSLSAFIDIYESEKYNHEWFIRRIEKYGDRYRISDNLRSKQDQLEKLLEINNYSLAEESDKYINFYYDKDRKIIVI